MDFADWKNSFIRRSLAEIIIGIILLILLFLIN